jgi:hypothetical protein
MLKKLTATGVLAFAIGGAAMLAAAPANADATNNGATVLSGNQVVVPITACGNTAQVIAVLPSGLATCGGDGHRHH